MKTTLSGLAVSILLLSNVAMTCPVCYGQTDANTASAVNSAIIVLLFVTGFVLTSFVSLFAYLRKRLKLTLNNNIKNPS